jgi:hypothetical protein
MYDVRNRITGRTLTSTSDRYRAADVARGFEQLVVRADLGGIHYYWGRRPIGLGQPHPIDADARAALQAELNQLVEYHRAGRGAPTRSHQWTQA